MSPHLNLTWWTSSMLGVMVPPSHRSAKWPTYLRVRFDVLLHSIESVIFKGENFHSRMKKVPICVEARDIISCKSWYKYKCYISIRGNRYMDKKSQQCPQILDPYQCTCNESSAWWPVQVLFCLLSTSRLRFIC